MGSDCDTLLGCLQEAGMVSKDFLPHGASAGTCSAPLPVRSAVLSCRPPYRRDVRVICEGDVTAHAGGTAPGSHVEEIKLPRTCMDW